MFNIPENNCTKCKHFAWWDGDYCCLLKNLILQESPDGKFNTDILIALKLNKNCENFEGENTSFEESFNEFKNKTLNHD